MEKRLVLGVEDAHHGSFLGIGLGHHRIVTGCVGHGENRILIGHRCHLFPWLDDAILGQHDGGAGGCRTVMGSLAVVCFRGYSLGGGWCGLFSFHQWFVSSQVDVKHHVLW